MVTLILTRIVFVLSIPLCLYAVYFGVVALFGLRKKLPAAPQAKPEKRCLTERAACSSHSPFRLFFPSLSLCLFLFQI